MKVAIRNNALRESVQVMGASETGSLLSYLVRMIPNIVLYQKKEDLLVGVYYTKGACQITIGAYGVDSWMFNMDMARAMDRYQDIVASRCLIEGLIYTVLGCFPTEINAGPVAGLFEWEDRPDPAIIFDSYYNPPTFTFNNLALAEQYLTGRIENVVWMSEIGVMINPGQEPPQPEQYEYDEATLHKREVSI